MKVIKTGKICDLVGTCQYCGTEIECGVSEVEYRYIGDMRYQCIYACPLCLKPIVMDKKEPQLLNE